METTIGNVCFIQDKNHRKVLLLQRSRDPMKNLRDCKEISRTAYFFTVP